MPGRAVYDLLYRIGAARWKRGWDSGVGPELRALVEDGTLSPERLGGNRAIDLGCGTGDNVIYLALHGFDATGVDFSPAGVHHATEEARRAGADARFVVADITGSIRNVEGPFDLVVLYNVIQDLGPEGRRGLARVATELCRAGTKVVLWCWYGRKRDLPPISYRGPSKVAPFVIEPGEERELFGDGFDHERPEPQPPAGKALFLLTRR